ncbi:hypothetical protein HME9304_01131 [Flagellimonas maritima]|uniref:Uncharacterized protein n=1 Tax=Flagellimonas maritima TaxID=1383885 RepID=A0A2Z4LQH3_9FLAO|nr:hypothetical protein [Allomuricauda aurantiaca]AWX44131.1 hypothetical protein HME9304_01131 [Allomuricauda aurantiaca]
MKKLILLFSCSLLFGLQGFAQEGYKHITFKHFTESRGDSESGMLLEIPYSDVVMLNNSLNSSSGFGFTINLHGNILVVDQMDVMPNGTTQVVLRREDGKDFYGYKQTIKAVLVKNMNSSSNLNPL